MKMYSIKSVVAIALVSMFVFSGCSKYDDGPLLSLKTKTARLAGEWEIVEIDGKSLIESFKDGFFENSPNPDDYDISGTFDQTFTFEKSGDFSSEMNMDITINYDDGYYTANNTMDMNMEMEGEWEWIDKKEGIEITFKKITSDGDDIDQDEWEAMGIDKKQEFEISRLTSKELVFEDEDGMEYTCEK